MLISKAALLGGAILATALVSACGGGNDNMTAGSGGSTSTGTTGSGAGSTTTTTTSSSSSSSTGSSGGLADDPPQVITSGGTVLSAPKIQLIAYAEDPNVADYQAFYEEFASTSEWKEQTGEYGIGPLTVLPPIMIAGTPPKTLNDNDGTITPFQQTLVDNVSGASPTWGAADPSTIYMFQLPKGTVVNSGGNCCIDGGFYGYHGQVAVGSAQIAYGVSCDCGAQQGPPTLTELETITTTLSHEAVEAASDPFPYTNLAWSGTDPDHLAWTSLTGGELADMCEYNLDSNYRPAGAKYMIQRSWSNAASKAGNNPCVPAPPTGPYFNSVPVLTDTVDETDQFGNSSPTKGVIIPLGQTKTIDVKLEADGTTSGPWTVTALDASYYFFGGDQFLDVSFDGGATSGMSTATGSAGDVLHLTIKSLKADTQDISAVFVLISDLGQGANLQENYSVGAVGN
jgi:hypothetical protein